MTSTDELRLADGVRDELLAHASESDDEVCGILAGRRGAASDDAEASDGDDAETGECDSDTNRGGDRVTDARRVPNVADAPRTRYELDPVATVETIDAIEAVGDEVVGFYHSHPSGPPRPSETDRTTASWPGYVYAIVVPPETVRTWRWTGDAFEPLDVRVADG